MGAIFSIASIKQLFKRPRGDAAIPSRHARSLFLAGEGAAEAASAFLLGLRYRDGAASGRALCRSVLGGSLVEGTYGCHFHLYVTPHPDDSHGIALCWSLARSDLRAAALVMLGRVANSCRKTIVVVDGEEMGIVLRYTTTL
ncbi:unnamed protein product [Phytomonas sp. Hart1]|nr:unnamed protein product [Phytomonas sp. Hart1]|eukprot:CCW68189.1 unnamed protein product [Phytomonas sp. isolate Hart1]